MRKKIIINLDNKIQKSIYQMIAEEGNCEKISLSDADVNYLIESGYLIMINNKNDLAIDIYEEEIICDSTKIKNVLNDTTTFIATEISNGVNREILRRIEKLFELAINKSCCIYFIL